MSIPKYHQMMLPILKLLADGKKHQLSEVRSTIANQFDLNEKELNEKLASGAQTIFDNRVGWAKTYLKKAELIDSPERGYVIINQKGKDLLKENLSEITSRELSRYDCFVEFKGNANSSQNYKTASDDVNETNLPEITATPQETLDKAYASLNNELMAELLSNIDNCSPFFFEKLVVDLLINMGYGGSRKEAGRAFQSSGDGGIDGIIKEDRLGLDVIYIQAKRWKKESVIGRPEIQKFAGALQGFRARKGVFITTSFFSKEARSYVEQIETKIILIDGKQLAEYMLDSNTGVTTVDVYKIKKIDLDYFQDG